MDDFLGIKVGKKIKINFDLVDALKLKYEIGKIYTVTRIKKCSFLPECKKVYCPGKIGLDNNIPECFFYTLRNPFIIKIPLELIEENIIFLKEETFLI